MSKYQGQRFQRNAKLVILILDLWLDGRIYPVDPSTGKRPRFNDVKTMLEFVGDGDNGLLGYSCSLQNSNIEICRRAVVD